MRLGLVPARSYAPELMDGDGNSDDDLAASLRDLERVNRWLGGTVTLRRPLEALVRRDGLRAFTLLDVGTGGGEVPRAVVAAARRRGIDARAVGVDLDPQIVRYARARGDRDSTSGSPPPTGAGRDTPSTRAGAPGREAGVPGDDREIGAAGDDREAAALSLLRADGFRLPFPDAAFDFVTSSLMFHHFPEPAAARLLGELARVARRAVVVNDLVRHRIPWAAITILAALGGSRMVRHDGPLSVLRGWRPQELMALAEAAGLAARARVRRLRPYRLVLVVERGAP